MNRSKVLLLALLLAGFAAMVRAAEFTMNVSVDGKDILNFGLARNAADDSQSKIGIPPDFGPAIAKIVYLEGPGDVDTADIAEDFSKLSRYIKEDADAALWKLVVEKATDNMTLAFAFPQGVSLPAGSYLAIYPADDETAAVDLTSGATLSNVAMGDEYIIDYRSSKDKEPAPLAPIARTFAILRATGPQQLVFDEIPEGFVLKADTGVTAFKLDDNDVYTSLGDGYGTVAINGGTATLTLTKLTDVARVQFAYWYESTDGAVKTENAAVIVNVNSGVSLTLEKRLNAADQTAIPRATIAVIPDEEGYDGTYVVYKVELADSFQTKALTYGLVKEPETPGKDSFVIQYDFALAGDAVPGDFKEMPADGVAKDGDVDGNATFYLWLKVKAPSSNCDNREVTPLVKDGEEELGSFEKTKFVIISSGTMDIDGNGTITEDDAIMMYNFIALGGIDDPESMFVEDIIQGIDETQVDAEAALATLKSLAAFLDYDENGAITEDDAIMMYNFIALGGIDDPESMFVEDIIQGIDETQVDAEKALENFKKYASK